MSASVPSRAIRSTLGRRTTGVTFTSSQRALVGAVLTGHGLLWWRAVHWFPELPERIPTHFDGKGHPDGWAAKSELAWYALPLLGTGLVVLFLGIAWFVVSLAARRPELCNMPKKRLFVALSAEGRREAVGPTRTFLLCVLLLLAGLFGWLVEGSARVAMGQQRTLEPWPVFVFVGAVLVMLVPYYVATMRRITALAKAEGVAGA